MKVNLKAITSVMDAISCLTAVDNRVQGILFDIGSTSVDVCFSTGNKTLFKTIDANTTDEDQHGRIIFDYKALSAVISACQPVGIIKTNDIEFKFTDNNTVKVVAEKRVPILDENGNESSDKVASVVEQTLSYVSEDKASIKVKVLLNERYDLLKHFDDSVISEKYPGLEVGERPMSTSEWDLAKDTWDISELRKILSKLSVENGKVMYISPKKKIAFVQNTSNSISIPFRSDIKYRIIVPTPLARAISDVLGKLADDTIYTHMIDEYRMVYSTADSKFGMLITNQKQEDSQISGFNNSFKRDYTNYLFNFNKDVMLSCLKGVKEVGASAKVEINFEAIKDKVSGEDIGMKLIMVATNTNSSTENKYDVNSEYFIVNNPIDTLKLNVTVDIILQAVSRIETPYMAFDISLGNDTNAIRIGELDTATMGEIRSRYINGGLDWNDNSRTEQRINYIGCTTYFASQIK